MRVIHLTSGGDVGGAKTHVLSLLHGLMKTDTVHLVCFKEGDFAREARELGIPVTIMESSNPIRVKQELLRFIEKEKFDIVHCHGARANMVGALLRKTVSAPVITTVHSDYRLDYLGRFLARMTYGNINTVALRNMDYYVAVSDTTADMLIQRNFDPQRIFPIYNGVDFPAPEAKVQREAYLESAGIRPCENMVVFGIAARLSAVKDIGTLIRGFAAAQATCPNIRLLIAGEGEQREELVLLAQQLCQEGSYAFCGWVSDMTSFYNALDVNVLSSLSEAFPYALPEGARMHCAAISTRVGGVPYYIQHGVDGLLFEPRDTETLTRHILRYAQDAEFRKTMAQALYEKTRRDFSVEATVNRQKEIYETVLRKEARKDRKRDGVMICGAYGRGNAGDDAILESIVTQMRQIDRDIPLYVLTRTPKQTAMTHRVGGIYVFDYFRYRRYLRKTILYINGGGSLIQDATSTRSLWYYLMSIATAKRMGNRVLMYGCGIGPVLRKQNRRMAGKVMNRYADIITLREDFSAEELRHMSVEKPEVKITADPAILLEPAQAAAVDAAMQQAGLKPDEKFFLISLRPWKQVDAHLADIAAAVAELAQKFACRPVYLAMEHGTDETVCRRAAELTGGNALFLSAPVKSQTLIGLIERAEVMISMRLHALIFAAGVGTPIVGMSYDPKVSGFVRYIGQGPCLELPELTREGLLSAAASALESEFDYAAQAKRLRALAEENKEAARRLLEENL